MKKNNIFVVEGKSDCNKLKSIYPDIVVIETHGIKINAKTINTIKLLSKNNNLYIFTDPDYAGLKIRKRINDILLGECIHIYLKNTNDKKKKKNGIAEAKNEDIKIAIENSLNFEKINQSYNFFTFSEYLQLNLDNKKIRLFIANKLNISYFNHKKFFKILNYLNISIDELKLYIDEYNDNKGK